MRYLFFALTLLGGISFGAVAYAGGPMDNGNDIHGQHNGDCRSDANSDAGFLCDDPSQTQR